MAAADPLTFRFTDDSAIPNNPKWPMLLYRGAVDLSGVKNPEARLEQMFADNGWGRGMWRNGVYPFVHYHSMIHEVLAIARGRGTVQFGGPQGETVELAPGDIALLPAGTGHQRLKASRDLVVIGAYPPQGEYDLCRGGKADHDRALTTIPRVPLPQTDPVYGANGPLSRLWRA
jgi:uncharacterized protein YjlB